MPPKSKRKSMELDSARKKKQRTINSMFRALDNLNTSQISGSNSQQSKKQAKKVEVDLTRDNSCDFVYPEDDEGVAKAKLNNLKPAISQASMSQSHISESQMDDLPSRSRISATVFESQGGQATEEASSPQLSSEQEHVLELVREGKNVFFTGNAGTGKTFLLNRLVAELRQRFGRGFQRRVAITATTGIAATHIGGTTLNSALGVGAPNTYPDFKAMYKKETKERIRGWDVLVIDESSMLSAEFLNVVEEMMREIRCCGKPFGGVQLILCGDFFQLPPITKRWTPGTPKNSFLNFGLAFQAPAWKVCGFEHVLLTKVFRQKDLEFVTLLDDIRYGRNTEASLQRLMQLCMRPLKTTGGIKPTQLFSRNKDVDGVNSKELDQLPGYVVTYNAEDSVKVHETLSASPDLVPEARSRLERNEFFRDCLATKEVKIKIGAQVMLLKNLDLDGGPNGTKQLVNGSRGVVSGMRTKAEATKDLMLQYKDLGGGVEELADGGFRRIGAPRIMPGDSRSKQRFSELERQMDALKVCTAKEIPVVRFLNGAEMTILPVSFRTEVSGAGECNRVQVPLKLAWAMTVHKCQGLTLDLVQVSLRGMFAEGQAYVALSRAKSLEGLQILDWESGCVRTDPTVAQFYKALQAGDMENFSDSSWQRWHDLRQNDRNAPESAAPAGGRGSQGPMAQQRGNFCAGGRGAAGGTGRNTCFKCGQVGHWASACQKR